MQFMMRFVFAITISAATAALAACKPAPAKHDPIRGKFLAACDGRIEYRSMKPQKRRVYCECVYERTIKGLSELEKQYAQFYLLEQVGVDAQSRQLIGKPDGQAMMKAAQALGKAAARCR